MAPLFSARHGQASISPDPRREETLSSAPWRSNQYPARRPADRPAERPNYGLALRDPQRDYDPGVISAGEDRSSLEELSEGDSPRRGVEERMRTAEEDHSIERYC
ncbi:hypothetical protein PBY51_014575 [Eleginops maclovinus]|uniref:Uncharacterized protein n=1 Tax=Eleginops maclovinus TaxID=56733 RepID=A0AAN7X004_ELEMC|nr:hypothetical protein PBY51_014575 [Eleginops maclovinus]